MWTSAIYLEFEIQIVACIFASLSSSTVVRCTRPHTESENNYMDTFYIHEKGNYISSPTAISQTCQSHRLSVYGII